MILVTGDWHFSDNPRDEYRHQWQKKLRAMVKKHNVTRTIVLGDICEKKDYHSAALVNRVVGHFARLARLCSVIVLKGNHDYVSEDSPFYEFLKRIPNVTWIGIPTDMIDVGLFLPHTNDWQRDWAKIKLSDHKWIFAHQTFEGARVGTRKLKGVRTDLFHPDSTIISGDIHQPQQIGYNLFYVGAPYTVDFGDDYEPRVILIDKGKRQSIPCSGPQKRLFTVDTKGSVLKLTGTNDHDHEKDILKIMVKLEKKDQPDWINIKNKIKSMFEDDGYVVHSVLPLMDKSPTVHRLAKRQARTDKQLLQDYAVQQGMDERVLKTGLFIMEKT